MRRRGKKFPRSAMDGTKMNAERPRFSILSLLELLAFVGIALAIGRAVPVYERYGVSQLSGVSRIVPLTGAILGACLGYRWFRKNELAWCGLMTVGVSTMLTLACLVPVIMRRLETPMSGYIVGLPVIHFLRVDVGTTLLGGIAGGLLIVLVLGIRERIAVRNL